MVRKVENQIIKEKCYTDRPKITYLLKNAEISPCEIRVLIDYDRGQHADSSYLKGATSRAKFSCCNKLFALVF